MSGEPPTSAPQESTNPQSASAASEREEPAYETNVARVEEIIHRLDTGEASLGETLELVREGKGLIERCAGELEAVGGALEELRLEDLVARLEGGAAGQRPAGRTGDASQRRVSPGFGRAPLPQSESEGTPK